MKKLIMLITTLGLLLTSNLHALPDDNSEIYKNRFLEMWSELHDSNNGYFSPEGVPYHSVETLIIEAPDYGHETTSEAISYYILLEAMYGRITGNWSSLETAWDIMERYTIPGSQDQPGVDRYNASSPATYASEFSLPDFYPSPLDTSIPVGQDPISQELISAYGSGLVYGMHWLFDVDNWYGYGNHGDGTSKVSYINTFQRGPQESVWETVTHPSWEVMIFGGQYGFLDLFTQDNNYTKQWRYTNAPDADARVVQAMYWANKWAKKDGYDITPLVRKSSKMGDWLRYSFFDKYFKKMGCENKYDQGATGYESSHNLLSWYYAWGGSTLPSWSWKIGSSHVHFGYQNPVAAYALGTLSDFKPASTNGARDWKNSLDRQIEFYQWLQSSEGAIAGGATNSYQGSYESHPSDVPTFYGMMFEYNPVYHDPGSGTWFGWQAWSMERVAEYYYITGDERVKNLLEKWTAWIKQSVVLTESGSFEIPSTLSWTGSPDTWTGTSTGNPNLHVEIEDYSQDVGIASCLARALFYYSAAGKKWNSQDLEAKTLGEELLDRMWNQNRDELGLSVPEKRGDYSRLFEQEIYIPEGWTGQMPNGDTIEPGVTFLDIRSKYKDDPDYQKVLDAYNAGTEPVFNYHRFWAQSDIALANATHYLLFNDSQGNETDTDNDGVFDEDDLCPNTPVDEIADENGCSPSQRDTDNDGVTDDLDQCPNTPEGEDVDANGCPTGTGPDDLTVKMTQVNSWPDGAQYEVSITNTLDSVMTDVELTLETDGSDINLWNMTVSGSGSIMILTLPSWKQSLNPGETYTFGFVLYSNVIPKISVN